MFMNPLLHKDSACLIYAMQVGNICARQLVLDLLPKQLWTSILCIFALHSYKLHLGD